MPLKRSILALRVVRGQPTAPFGMHRSEWLYISSVPSISAPLWAICFLFDSLECVVMLWTLQKCYFLRKNAISFYVSSRKGAVIAANWLEYLARLLTKPRKLFRFLALSWDSIGSMAVTFLLSGLAPSGVQGWPRKLASSHSNYSFTLSLRAPENAGCE